MAIFFADGRESEAFWYRPGWTYPRESKLWGDSQQPLQGETVKEFGRQSSVKESKAELEEGNSKQDVATEEAQPVIELEEEGNSKQVAEGVTVQEQPPESKPANEFGRHNSGKTDKDNNRKKRATTAIYQKMMMRKTLIWTRSSLKGEKPPSKISIRRARTHF